MKTVAILGSTGSIGTQAIEVARELEDIQIQELSAATNGDLLLEQAKAVGAWRVALSDREAAERLAPEFKRADIELVSGPEGIVEVAGSGCDIVLNAIVGSAGLEPTLAALSGGKVLALANKESLVAGGRLVKRAAMDSGATIIPVDSEHSAIFQCLKGEEPKDLRRIVLTASGGAFRERSFESLGSVTLAEALAHPNWDMGPKVTIDSATLMNKGLEVIEAHHLFDAWYDRIDVLLHPQSVVHSMVEMVDGTVLAHMGVPDMRIPVQYAFTWPGRMPSPTEPLSLAAYGELTFAEVDMARWPALRMAYEAGESGGTCPAAMNAANEEAVKAFIEGRVSFTDITRVVAEVLESHEPLDGARLEEVREAESSARRAAAQAIEQLEKQI